MGLRSTLRRVGGALSRPYRLVRDGEEDLDAVYPDHDAKPGPEQVAVQGLGRRGWFRRS